jgi:hypothetical protein
VSEELYQTTPLENPTHQPSSSVFVFIGSFHDDVSVCLGFHRLRKREVSEGGTAAGATVFQLPNFSFFKKSLAFRLLQLLLLRFINPGPVSYCILVYS